MNYDDWTIEPDNNRCRQYYETELDFEMDCNPFVLTTLCRDFHEHLVEQSDKIIRKCRFKRKGRVIELMAGCGRNNDLLRQHFGEVEMLERNESMVEAIKRLPTKPDKVHHEDLRQFDWSALPKAYQCVFSVWCLGYLSKAECI